VGGSCEQGSEPSGSIIIIVIIIIITVDNVGLKQSLTHATDEDN
jgi:hypothetical protein